MNTSKDLHICGVCRKIFNDINLFLEHKSKCSFPPNNTEVAQEISFENELFSHETVLDLTVPVLLENESFSFVLQYDNEEVVTDDSLLEDQVASVQDQLNQILKSNKIINEINEDDVATLLVNQLSKEVVNQSHNLKTIHQSVAELSEDEKLKNNSKSKCATIGNEPNEKKVVKETKENKTQKIGCKICNYVPNHRPDLVRHMRKHTGERPYKCNVCDKKFARQDKLLSHNRMHQGDKRHRCELCDYATTESASLKKHQRIHTDERPYKCQMCSYRARNTSHMNVHLRTHTGDTPFFCQLETCGRAFKTSTDMKRHAKVHRRKNLSPTYSSFGDISDKSSYKGHLKDKRFVHKSSSCYICQDASHKVGGRQGCKGQRGVRSACMKEYQCDHCSAAFVRQDSLRSHSRLHRQPTPPPPPQEDLDRLDEEEVVTESESVTSPLEEMSFGDATTTQNSVLLYIGNTDSLQDSFISLETDSDSPVQYVLDKSFL